MAGVLGLAGHAPIALTLLLLVTGRRSSALDRGDWGGGGAGDITQGLGVEFPHFKFCTKFFVRDLFGLFTDLHGYSEGFMWHSMGGTDERAG